MVRWSFFVGICLLFASCSRPVEAPISRDLSHVPLIVGTLEKRDRLILYEGLPHPRAHRKVFAEELAAKKIMVIRNHYFYNAVIEMKPEDAARLGKLLGDLESFRPNSGHVKKCDGFHPDFCAEWQVGEDVYQALICLGCWEVQFHGPGSDVLCDITREARKALVELLNPYHVKLPKLE
jgi:hypothetical protein